MMNLTINSYKLGERPDVTRPHPDFYKFLGEAGIRTLVDKHYEMLRASEIKHLFAKNDEEFAQQKQNSADFMVQICGGPDYFNQRRGQPKMVARHASSKITSEGRIIWLTCYQQLLSELENVPESAVQSFWDYINVFSAWMVNTDEEKPSFHSMLFKK